MDARLRWAVTAAVLGAGATLAPRGPEAGCCIVDPEPPFTGEAESLQEPDLDVPIPQPGVATALAGAAASAEATARIVAEIDQDFGFCSAIVSREYIVDCVGAEIRRTAETLPEAGDYGAVRGALTDAADRLDAIVAASPSPDLPTGVARSTGADARVSARPLRPVATAAADAAIAAAADVIDETRTVLLRSADDGSPTRALALQTVAASLDGGTVLLRSA